jgi:hypothetical protein
MKDVREQSSTFGLGQVETAFDVLSTAAALHAVGQGGTHAIAGPTMNLFNQFYTQCISTAGRHHETTNADIHVFCSLKVAKTKTTRGEREKKITCINNSNLHHGMSTPSPTQLHTKNSFLLLGLTDKPG